MSEKSRIAIMELAAVILTAALVCGPLLIAAVSRNLIQHAPYQQHCQIWDWIFGGRVTDWLLVGVGLLQWGIYRRQTSILKRQTIIQIASARPNIFVREIHMTETNVDAAVGQLFVYQPVWKNTGQIPPRTFMAGAYFQVRPDEELPLDHSYSVIQRSMVPIARDMEAWGDPLILTEAKMRQCLAGERRLFIWGSGQYTDDLSPDVIHCVDFCYRTEVRRKFVAFLVHGPHNRVYDQPK